MTVKHVGIHNWSGAVTLFMILIPTCACQTSANIWNKNFGFILHNTIIITIIIKWKVKAQINRKASQMRHNDAATENYSLQCNVNEIEMFSAVSEN